MNSILRNILNAAKDFGIQEASALLPGSSVLISGVTKLIDHDHTNNAEAISELESGAITALKSLKGDQVGNATLLAEGIAELEDGFKKVKASIK